jgi:myosin-crossreactive antigen
LARGIYLYPKKDNILGVIYPDIETIAQEIAKRDNARIIPTGAQALNLLGLSTQVPLKVVFLTDSSPRTITINNRTIKFKKTSPKNLAIKGHITGLAIQALKEIGKDKVTWEQIKIIKEQLKKEQLETLYHDMKLAPSWIADIFGDLLMYYYE